MSWQPRCARRPRRNRRWGQPAQTGRHHPCRNVHAAPASGGRGRRRSVRAITRAFPAPHPRAMRRPGKHRAQLQPPARRSAEWNWRMQSVVGAITPAKLAWPGMAACDAPAPLPCEFRIPAGRIRSRRRRRWFRYFLPSAHEGLWLMFRSTYPAIVRWSGP